MPPRWEWETRVSSTPVEPAHNLPSRLTSFVGREREVVEVAALIDVHRLVTLAGAPGVGKTRLSLQIAANALGAYPDGAWLVQLAPLTDATLVPQAVADVLGVRDQPGRSLTTTLADWLRPRRLLLLLDNCEHLIGAAAVLTETLLQACPQLHVLATSREPLAIEGEITWRVPSLVIPDAGHLRIVGAPTAARLADAEAVRLFIERARAVVPSFVLTDQVAPVVAQICARLDGIPLAIELAAARTRALSLEQIAARLDGRFHLVTQGSRTALPRQQTLRGAIDWSYDLLPDPEQALLRRLAVFAGGFTLEAIEGVGFLDSGLEEGSTRLRPDPELLTLTDTLISLVDKSLVQVEEGDDGERRYRLLEMLRQYGREKLAEHGELADARNRHRDHWLSVAEDAQRLLDGAGQHEALRRLEREHDNLRAALAWCLQAATRQPVERESSGQEPSPTSSEIGSRLAGALWRFWWLRGHLDEGRRWLDRVVAIPCRSIATSSERSGRALAHFGAAHFASGQGEPRSAVRHMEIALSLSREVEDDRAISQALHRLGFYHLHLGEHDLARRLCEESVEIARRTDDPYTLAMALQGSSQVTRFLDEHDRTVSFCEEGLTLLRELGDVVMSAYMLRSLSGAVYGIGDRARALVLAEEALGLSLQLGDKRGQGESYQILGNFALREGDIVRAIAMLQSAVSTLHESGDRWLILWAFFRLADARTQQGVQAVSVQGDGQPPSADAREYFLDAARLFAAVDAHRRRHGIGPVPQLDRAYDGSLSILGQHLGESTFSRAWAAGQSMSFEQVVAYALEMTGSPTPTELVRPGGAGTPSPAPQLALLTPREREIAALVARGRSNRQIAADLVVSARTAETHVHNVLGKLELTSRAQLAVWAIEHGLPPSGGQ